jgi:hypothetical protein
VQYVQLGSTFVFSIIEEALIEITHFESRGIGAGDLGVFLPGIVPPPIEEFTVFDRLIHSNYICDLSNLTVFLPLPGILTSVGSGCRYCWAVKQVIVFGAQKHY